MKKTIISSVLAVAALAPIASFASDGTINFTGAVTSQTCTINSGASSTFTVALPKVATSALATAGAKAGQTAFTIALSNCSPASGNARAFFEAGANVDPVSGRLNIATGAGNATNVQIGLATIAGADIKIGASSGAQGTTPVAIAADGTANLSYLAQYVATGAATAGATTSSVTYTIEFQ